MNKAVLYTMGGFVAGMVATSIVGFCFMEAAIMKHNREQVMKRVRRGF